MEGQAASSPPPGRILSLNEEQRTAAIAAGVESLVGPAVRDCNAHVEAALLSQERLAAELSRLTEELDSMLEHAPTLSPVSVRQAALVGPLHKRVVAVSTSLKTIQERMNNMNKVLSDREALLSKPAAPVSLSSSAFSALVQSSSRVPRSRPGSGSEGSFPPLTPERVAAMVHALRQKEEDGGKVTEVP